MAAIFAVKDALRQAGPILLEPIMAVKCVVPDEYQDDLKRRRGRIVGFEEQVRGTDSVEVTLQAEARWRNSSAKPTPSARSGGCLR